MVEKERLSYSFSLHLPLSILDVHREHFLSFDKCSFRPSLTPPHLPIRIYRYGPLGAIPSEKGKLKGRGFEILEYIIYSLADTISSYILSLYTWFVVFLPSLVEHTNKYIQCQRTQACVHMALSVKVSSGMEV